MGSLYIEIAWNIFLRKSFVKFFPTLEFKIESHSHKKGVSPKLENSAHLFIVYFSVPSFRKLKEPFCGREVGR